MVLVFKWSGKPLLILLCKLFDCLKSRIPVNVEHWPVVMVDCATYRPMIRDSPCRRYNLWSQNYISDTGMWSQCNRKFGLNWRKLNLNCGQPYLPESSTSIARRRESGDHIWPQCSRKQLNSPPKSSGDHIWPQCSSAMRLMNRCVLVNLRCVCDAFW